MKNPISDGFMRGGGESCGRIAAGMGNVLSAHAVVFLEVADDGLDGGSSFEFAALLAARIDLELVIGWGVVAAIGGIGDAAIEDVADERLHLRNDRAERVPLPMHSTSGACRE